MNMADSDFPKKTSSWRTPPEPIPDNKIQEVISADVVVVGGGHSGSAAARASAEAGASVVVIESQKEKSFHVFGNDIGHINSRFLASRGVPPVDVLEFFNDWQLRGGNRANPKLVMQFCRKSGECVDWMLEPCAEEQISSIDVRNWPAPKYFEGEVSGIKTWSGAAWFSRSFSFTEATLLNHRATAAAGACFLYDTTALQLVKDGNRVAGVIAKTGDGRLMKISSSKGVILAAGDFSRDGEMVMDLCHEIADLAEEGKVIKGIGRDGSGIKMGIWAGGVMVPSPIATMGGNYFYPAGLIGDAPVLWLDQNGNRFCNEGFGDHVLASLEALRLPGKHLYSIFDSNVLEHIEHQYNGHGMFWTKDDYMMGNFIKCTAGAKKAGAQGYLIKGLTGDNGRLYCADSFGKLAEYCGFTGAGADCFVASVRRYNEACRNGRDEDFGKDPRLLHTFDKPSYYAYHKQISAGAEFLATVDGLWTDEYQNVLNKKREPIAGLYATGNCCGRRWGVQYSTPITGVCIGMAWTLGREVGKTVAAISEKG